MNEFMNHGYPITPHSKHFRWTTTIPYNNFVADISFLLCTFTFRILLLFMFFTIRKLVASWWLAPLNRM